MRRTAAICASVAFVVFSSVLSAANAADLPRPAYKAPVFNPEPVYSWTGFYIGLHAGYGWTTISGSDPTGTGTGDLDGWLAGGQLGYNYQIGKFVVGVEGDLSAADVKFSVDDPLGLGGGNATVKNDYFATLALRLGYAFDRFLVYGKGGAAFTREKWDITDGVGGFANGSFRRTGWMLGAGVEYALWNAWSIKAEYNYLHFGSIDEVLTTGGGLVAAGPATASSHSHLLKFGLNWRFM
ncbi:MAG: outer membrane protein [Pseudolabrys sp.]